jgi:hypothetical protein
MATVLVDGFNYAGDCEAALPAVLCSGMYFIRLSAGSQYLASVQFKR